MVLSVGQAHFHVNYSFFYDKKYPEADPISLLLSGNHAIISHVIKNYRNVSMIGISGGGWTTTLLSALIPKIQHSISYAGTIPLFLRTFPGNIGDYEQVLPPLWREYDYWNFYFLGQLDRLGIKNRRFTLVYSKHDNCCFSDPGANIMKEIFDTVGGVQVMVLDVEEHAINVHLALSLLFDE